MKTFLHFLLAFTFGLLTAALIPIFFFDASVEVQAQVPYETLPPRAQANLPYELRGPIATATLPAGYLYGSIEAWVPQGETHGLPYLLAAPVGVVGQGGLFVAKDTAGGMTFGNYMPAITLRQSEMGGDSSPSSFLNDLKRNPDGSPLLIGASTSPRAVSAAFESTTWELNNSRTDLVPKALGFVGGNDRSILVGGNPVDGYAGTDTTVPAFIPPTGGGQVLPLPNQVGGGEALDLDGATIVGVSDFHAFFFNKTQSGSWVQGSLSLPNWSEGTGSLTDVAGSLMGGNLFNPNVDDVVPVIWNTDGTINKIFDLPGYSVTEMIVDQGTVIALLNQGTLGNFSGPSLIYAEGWVAPREFFGDIVPSLPNGTSGYVADISSGGSLWVLAELIVGNRLTYTVTSVASSSDELPQPEGTWHNPKLGGDVNNDGFVSSLDALFVADMLRVSGAQSLPKAPLNNKLFVDVNGDNKVSIADLTILIDYIYTMYKRPLLSAATTTRILSPLDGSTTIGKSASPIGKQIASIGLLAILAAGTKNPMEVKALVNFGTLLAAANLQSSMVAAYLRVYPKPQPIILPFIFFH